MLHTIVIEINTLLISNNACTSIICKNTSCGGTNIVARLGHRNKITLDVFSFE